MKCPAPVQRANEIRLLRQQHTGAFLIVEGKDDRLTFKQHIDDKTCKIIVAENKTNVCEVVRILNVDQFSGALGVVDADFDRIEGQESTHKNIISPEGHDLESLLLRSSTLSWLLRELGSEPKIENFGEEVIEVLLREAYKIGCLRLYSQRNDLALRFGGLRYANFVNKKTLKVDERALVQETLNRSQKFDLSVDRILSELNQLISTMLDPWEICVGPDILNLLAIGLKKALGSKRAGDVAMDNLKQLLRMSFSEERLHSSNLWDLSKQWESENSGFKIFK